MSAVNSVDTAVNTVEDYVATLTATLHGPARAKARMIEEIRDGLTDTVAAHAGDGVPDDRAAERAVREFGTPDELVPGCQRELTIAQARHTGRAAALTAPFLIACWYLTGSAGQHEPVQFLAMSLAGVAIVVTLLAAGTLAATGTLARWLPTPRRLPLVVAWAGTTAGAAMALATLALATAAALATNWPLLVLAGTLAAASHAVVATSARACRRCARLTTPHPAVVAG